MSESSSARPAAKLPAVAVFGGDARQRWMAEALERRGLLAAVYQVPDYTPASPQVAQLQAIGELARFDWLAGPVPLSRAGRVTMPPEAAPCALAELAAALRPGQHIAGGNLPPDFARACAQQGVTVYDFMTSAPLLWANAALTAEGMIAALLAHTPFALAGAPLLLVGYGRCGQTLAQKLRGLDVIVTICEIDESRRAQARAAGFAVCAPDALPALLASQLLLVNTVPAPVLTASVLDAAPPELYLFDLASSPGGVDTEAARARGLACFACPGLPGRIAPQTAGELLADDLLRRIDAAPRAD